MNVLHAASECFPLAKTGGLGDVVGALPPAQRKMGADARVLLPAYRGVREKLGAVQARAKLRVRGLEMAVLEGELGGMPVYLLDCPALYERPGDPYQDASGVAYADNAWRFGVFSIAIAQIADGAIPGYRPELLHLHDWQAGLAAPIVARKPGAARRVYTIHNLAYQGRYTRDSFDLLALPPIWWHADALEYWGDWSFMKAGINFSDAITTVSPSYAREIQTADFGCGLDPLLRARSGLLHGITNGIDDQVWDPQRDPHLAVNYGAADVQAGKRANKQALQAELGLTVGDQPLLVFIGRLAEQKGADLLLAARDGILASPLQVAVLAAGDPQLQTAFREFAANAPPGRVAVAIAHDERLAHRMTAAADLLLMPSRFEPCGLSQMYAQRYGTIPVVHRTGGLADTVVDANPATLADGSASGVHFLDADLGGVLYGLRRGLELLADEATTRQLQRTGTAIDWSWQRPAERYLALYRQLVGGHE